MSERDRCRNARIESVQRSLPRVGDVAEHIAGDELGAELKAMWATSGRLNPDGSSGPAIAPARPLSRPSIQCGIALVGSSSRKPPSAATAIHAEQQTPAHQRRQADRRRDGGARPAALEYQPTADLGHGAVWCIEAQPSSALMSRTARSVPMALPLTLDLPAARGR